MPSKLLCACHNVTLEDVKKAIEDGVTTFAELQEKTNIGTDCPPCKDQNVKLFKQLLETMQK